MTSYIGYHFTGNTLRDGSPIPPVGEKLVFDGEIEICKSGLHWSEHPFDALKYAPGKWLHIVECSKPVESENDKHVSRERTILKTINAEYLLLRFAADQALSVAHPVAHDAAWTAALDAAWDAAWTVAWEAAHDAAWDVAWAAARSDFQRRVDEAFGAAS